MTSGPGILFVSRYFWPELIGSAPFSTDLAEWLARHGRQTTVVSGLPHYPGSQVFTGYEDRDRHRETVRGSVVQRLAVGAPRGDGASSRIANEAEFLLRGLAALATGRIRRHAIVLALCPSILSVALGLAARGRKGVCIAIVHDIQSGLAEGLGISGAGPLTRLMRACERTVLNRADLVVVLSEEMKNQLLRIGVRSPIEVVPLWVDTDVIRAIDPTSNGPVQVLYSGNLGRKQGLDQVVALAEQLAAVRPDIEIVLRGNGSRGSALAAEVNRRHLRNIRFTELQPNEALGPALAAGDIHLVPQNPAAAAFAVPSKVFNIMAVGRPFVATALPGSVLWTLQRESEAFLCVPPGDPGAFADAVIRLADDAHLRSELGRRGRAFVELNYAKSRVLGAFMNRLDAVAAAR
ncbi:MAG: glycosyltransferase family 4 protein [Pseudomonadota bacterium]